MLVQIVSPERAKAEGTEASQILLIAQWHEDQIAHLNRDVGKKPPAKSALKRHKRLASELRALAGIMAADNQAGAV